MKQYSISISKGIVTALKGFTTHFKCEKNKHFLITIAERKGTLFVLSYYEVII